MVPVWIVALGEFQGGGLWVESSDGQGPVLKQLPSGVLRAGFVRDIHENPYTFNGRRWHCTEPWCGRDRWVVVAYAPQGAWKILDEYAGELEGLGFSSSGGLDSCSHQPRASISKFNADKFPCEKEMLPWEGLEGSHESPVEVDWEVEFPCEVLRPGWREHALRNHLSSAVACKAMSKELSGFSNNDDTDELFRTLTSVERQRDWYEGLLWEDFVRGSGSLVKALNRDVSLNPDDQTSPAEVFLQTRTVSLAEAKSELELWIPSATDEVMSLEVTNKAVERIGVSDIERLVQEGRKVVQVPGKAVLTRKAGIGKRRFRCVACGNYIPSDAHDPTSLYASGVEGLTVRTALGFAAYRGWAALSADIRTAFLHAPLADELESEEVIIVRPPSILVEMKILASNHRWRVLKALYGLRQAPLAWARFRDKSLRALTFQCGGVWYALRQGISDDSLWFIVKSEVAEGDTGRWHGILIIYVDDLLGFASSPILKSLFDEIQKLWQLSDPEWIREDGATKFCGLEIQALRGGGYRISQYSYLQELFARYGITNCVSAPLTQWSDPEDEQPVQLETAQAMTGALLWASSKSRPDIAFVVSKLGQFAVKAPSVVIDKAYHVLKYLYGTVDLWLEYRKLSDNSWADAPVPRTTSTLELYTDASHAPEGGRSCQAIFILWCGMLLCWEASKQPFVTLSSAEAELVAVIAGIVAAESVGGIIEELTESDVTISALCDNQATVRSFAAGSLGWRSRHLRMRAAAGRERVENGSLVVTYVPGSIQLADLATKPLAKSRIFQLADLMGLRSGRVQPAGDGTVRMVSRVSKDIGSCGSVSPRTLAGLALMAACSGVKAQPMQPVGMLWVFGVLVGLVLIFWAQRFLGLGLQGFGFEEVTQVLVGDAVTIAGFEEPAQAPLELEVEDEEGSNASDSDQFSEAGWLEVSKKLRDQEIKTGLTFVQRARLRKQISLGGLVDPPVMMERYGGLPDWMTRPEPSLSPRPSVQVGGSASSGSAPAPGPVLNTSDEVTAGDAGTGDPGITLLDYEDLFDEDEGLGPPCVGGLVTGQFLGVLLSIGGGCILGYVGFEEGDVANWLTCSNSCRIAIVSAIAEQWRLLPGGIACDGHGVPMLIQEAVLRGTVRLRSPVDTLGVGCGIGLSSAGLSGLLVDHGELLVACLGLHATEWRCLACAASSLSSDPKIALILRFQDTGRESSGLVGQGWRIEFRFEMAENGSSWVPVSLLSNEGSSSSHRFDGGSSQQIPSSSSVQIGGSSSLQSFYAGSSQQIPSSSSVQIGGSSSSQSFYAGSSQQIPSSSSVQIGGSSSSQSFYPGSGQQSSFSSSAHIGGSSSTSRFFDAGMAYMQADESPPGFLRHPLEEDVEDDPTIDDRPHRPVRPQVPRVLQVFREEAWSSSESGDSTTEPSVCSSSNSPAESDALWAIRDTEARVSQSVEPPALGVMFQADPGYSLGFLEMMRLVFHYRGGPRLRFRRLLRD